MRLSATFAFLIVMATGSMISARPVAPRELDVHEFHVRDSLNGALEVRDFSDKRGYAVEREARELNEAPLEERDLNDNNIHLRQESSEGAREYRTPVRKFDIRRWMRIGTVQINHP